MKLIFNVNDTRNRINTSSMSDNTETPIPQSQVTLPTGQYFFIAKAIMVSDRSASDGSEQYHELHAYLGNTRIGYNTIMVRGCSGVGDVFMGVSLNGVFTVITPDTFCLKALVHMTGSLTSRDYGNLSLQIFKLDGE